MKVVWCTNIHKCKFFETFCKYILRLNLLNKEDLAPHHLSFIQPVQSSEHMAAFGVFGLCQIHAFVDYLRSKLNAQQFEVLFKSVISLVGFILLSVGAVLMLTGEMFYILKAD